MPALADETAIRVGPLNGAPGVDSARHAGEPKSDEPNNQARRATQQGESNRKAHYYCVMVYVRYPDDPQPIIAEGSWHGEIIDMPRGAGGFGYDPYFLLPAFGRTGAELSAVEKNGISHRGQALRALVERLKGA